MLGWRFRRLAEMLRTRLLALRLEPACGRSWREAEGSVAALALSGPERREIQAQIEVFSAAARRISGVSPPAVAAPVKSPPGGVDETEDVRLAREGA